MSTSTVSSSVNTSSTLTRSTTYGVIAGVVGGIAFGILMAFWGMLPMVGDLIGSTDATIGFIVHMGISALGGALFGVAASFVPVITRAPITAGVIYGFAWWVGGALIAMPLMLGMNEMVLQVEAMQTNSLLGHLFFGLLVADVYRLLNSRSAE